MKKEVKTLVKAILILTCLTTLFLSLYLSYQGYEYLKVREFNIGIEFRNNFENHLVTALYILGSLGMSVLGGLLGVLLMTSRQVGIQWTSIANSVLHLTVFLFWCVVLIQSVLFSQDETLVLLNNLITKPYWVG